MSMQNSIDLKKKNSSSAVNLKQNHADKLCLYIRGDIIRGNSASYSRENVSLFNYFTDYCF